MANDSTVIVSIKADDRELVKGFQSAVRTASNETKKLQKQLDDLKLKTGGANIAGDFKTATTQISNDARVMQFQLNDIFSGLASGQGIRSVQQQLGQIAQGLQGGGGVVGAAGIMKEALLGMVNPINIGIVAFGLLATAAASYFGDTSEAAEEEAKRLREEAQLLDEVAKKWGDLVPAIQAAQQAQEAAADSAEKTALKQKMAVQIFAAATTEIADVTGSLAGVQADMQLAMDPTVFTPFSAAVADLAAATEPTVEQIDAVIKGLKAWREQNGSNNETLNTAIERLENTRRRVAAANTEYGKLEKQLESANRIAKEFNETVKKMADIGKAPVTEMEKLVALYEEALRLARMISDEEERHAAVVAATLANRAGTTRLQENATDEETRQFARERVRAIVHQESGGDPNAKNPDSSALGVGQFLKDTWLGLMREFRQDLIAGKSEHEILEMRRNATLAAEMVEEYAVKNIKAMRAAGLDIVDGAVYLAHFLGPDGAMKVLREVEAGRGGTSAAGLVPTSAASNKDVFAKHPTAESLLEWAAGVEANTKATKETKKNYDELVASIIAKTDAQKRENEINADSTLSTDERTDALQRQKAAQETARIELELNNAAQAQGIELTDELRKKNHDLAVAAAEAGLAADQLTEAQKRKNEQDKKNEQSQEAFNRQVSTMAKSAIGGFINDLRNGVEAGEAFANMLDRIIDGLINMALEALFSKEVLGGVIGNFLGGLTGGFGGVVAPAAASGGKVGESGFSSRMVSPSVFVGAPRMARGGIVGLRAGEYPIIAHQGELIIPKNMVGRAAGNGNGRIDQSVHQENRIAIDMSRTGAVTANNEDARKFGVQVQRLIQAELIKESRPGGLLRSAPR